MRSRVKTIKYKSVLVTGGSGFLGRHLISHLLDKGFDVRCFDRIKPLWMTPDIDFIEGDFTAARILEPAVRDIDAIIHLVDLAQNF
jgi:nucleoside-diphosphate-sugar epimerase